MWSSFFLLTSESYAAFKAQSQTILPESLPWAPQPALSFSEYPSTYWPTSPLLPVAGRDRCLLPFLHVWEEVVQPVPSKGLTAPLAGGKRGAEVAPGTLGKWHLLSRMGLLIQRPSQTQRFQPESKMSMESGWEYKKQHGGFFVGITIILLWQPWLTVSHKH